MKFGFCTVLFFVFLILKLTGTIAWSWVWVTSPLWIGFIVYVVLMLFSIIIFALINKSLTRSLKSRTRRK